MSSQLPPRPSLAQLRKLAKERLATLRSTDASVKLSAAQHALAIEYGFESWPKLVHHIEQVRTCERLEHFSGLAHDLLAGYGGDGDALDRLIRHFGVSYNRKQLQTRVRKGVDDARGASPDDPATYEPTLEDVRALVAHQYGFAGWAELESGVTAAVASECRDKRRTGDAEPFYRIDPRSGAIEPLAPIGAIDWSALFAVMRDRRTTAIRTSALSDAAAAGLAKLDFVTSVDLDGAQLLGDDGLLELAAMPQLNELVLGGGHSQITDRGLALLNHLPRLRRFSMCWPQRISDEGVGHLASCRELERVELMGTPTGDGAIRALAGLPRLTQLSTGRATTDDGVRLLSGIPAFMAEPQEEVRYNTMSFGPCGVYLMLDGPFTDRGLETLSGLHGLQGIDLFWHAQRFTGRGLGALSALAHLSYLGCQQDRCDDEAMSSIARLPHLRMLMAQGTTASDTGFASLAVSRSLKFLWGRECPNLTGRGFAALADLPTLRGIGVSCERVDDDSLAALARFPSLTELVPMDVRDDGFLHVGRCERLERLTCMYCRDTGDAATAHIRNLSLKYYYAGSTRITDRSLDMLGAMETLEGIELSETAGVSDAGVQALTRLPKLQAFTISGAPRVSPAGVSGFAKGVRVDYRP